jgi:autotransporter-associated beta strand protein
MKNTNKYTPVHLSNKAVAVKRLVNDGKFHFRPAGLFSASAALALVALGAGASQVQAASATWSGATSGSWATTVTGNWTGGAVAGSLTVGNTDTATFASNVNPAVTLNQYLQIGGITFDTANAGAFVISGGTLGLSTSTYTGAAAKVYVSSAVTAAETINSPMVLRNSGTFSFVNDAISTNGTLNIGGPLSSSATISQLVLGGNNTGNNTISGGISVSATPIAKTGTGTWIISGTNTFGTLTSGSTGLSGGLLILSGSNISSGPTTIYSGTLQVGNGGTLGNLPSGTVTNNASLVFNRSDALTVASLISGTGALTQAGAGNLTLTAGNTYSGGTIINSGTLTLGATGVLASSSAITLNGGALWASVTNIALSNPLSVSADSVIHTADTAGSLLTLSGTISGSSKLGVNFHNGGSVALTSDLSHFNGTLSLVNSGTLSFLSGTTVIATGTNTTLDLGSAGTVVSTFGGSHPILFGALQGGTGAQLLGTTTAASAVITYSIGSLGLSSTFGGIIGNGSGTGSSTALTLTGGNLILAGANTYTGATAINSGTLQIGNSGTTGSLSASSAITNNGTLVFNRSNAVVEGTDFASTISGTGGLTQAGSGVLTLGGNNTYTGATSVTGGTLTLNGTLAAASAVSVSGATLAGSGTATGTVAVNGGTINGTGLKLGAATFTGASTLAGTSTVSSIGISNGTTTVTGTATVSGATTVSGGAILSVNGSLKGTASIGATETLGGSGTITGATSVQGTLAAGNGIGTLNTGSLTLDSTSTLDVELGRNAGVATSDLTNVTGSVNLVSGANLKLTLATGTALQGNDLIFLIDNDGTDAVQGVFTSLNGVTTTLTEGSTFSWNSQTWEITYKADSTGNSLTGGNDVALQVQAVPEPNTWAMIVGGMGLLIVGQKFRKHHNA